jgi:hypothetical protein
MAAQFGKVPNISTRLKDGYRGGIGSRSPRVGGGGSMHVLGH